MDTHMRRSGIDATRRGALAVALALTALGSACTAPADGFIVVRDLSPRPISSARPDYTPLEVRHHHVAVKVRGRVAVTEVDQTFYNPGGSRLEGTYLFPIPRGARLDRFSIDVNGKAIEAELLDAVKARALYDEIVRSMRDPALLEYTGQGLFKVRIFPIEPGSEKRVQLRYTELLKQEGGLLQYLYPLNTEKFSARPLRSVSVKVDVELPEGIRTVYSPSHEIEVTRQGPTRAAVGFESRDTTPDTDFQLFLAPSSADVAVHVITHRDPAEPDGTFLLVVSPSAEMDVEKVIQKDVVFVLDTSGSMAEGKKLDQAKRALSFCLKNLNRGDRFEVVRFSTETEPLFGGLADAVAPNLERAEAFVSGLRPIGGTAIDQALTRALAPLLAGGDPGRPYTVVFLTDGRPTVGSTDDDEIVSKVARRMRDRPVRIFCFGIGTDVNTHLLDRLSESTRGASQYVLPNEDLELKLSSFYSKISQPVLADPRLAVQGSVRITQLAPPELPDLFKGEQIVVLGRYSGSGDATITLSGSVNGSERRFTYQASFAARATEHDFVPRLWATRRIGFLLDQIRLHGESTELRDEVTALARRFGIVTPYTAFLVLEDEARRNVPAQARTIQAPGRGGVGRLAAAAEMYKDVREKKSGDAAVAGAQAFDSLKRARNAAAPSIANSYSFGAFASSPATAAPAPVRELVQAQATRVVGGRAFYQNGTVWVDSSVQGLKAAPTRQVKFGSSDYTGLQRKHPDAARWLSVGRNVKVLVDGTVYEVVD